MPASLKRACVAERLRADIRISLCAITSSTYSLPLPGPPPATVYRASGQLDRALPLLEETLKLRQAKLGPGHPDTRATMKGVKFLRALSSAGERYRAKLAELGPKHIDTLLAR